MSVLQTVPVSVIYRSDGKLAMSVEASSEAISSKVVDMDAAQDGNDVDFGKDFQRAIFNLKALNGQTEFDRGADEFSSRGSRETKSPALPECIVVEKENGEKTPKREDEVILIDDSQIKEEHKELDDKNINSSNSSIEKNNDSPKAFSIDDKMRNSFRILVSKMQETNSGLTKNLSKPKEPADVGKTFDLPDINNSTSVNSATPGGNLFEKLGRMKSTDDHTKTTEGVLVNGEDKHQPLVDVIDLEDSLEENENETDKQISKCDNIDYKTKLLSDKMMDTSENQVAVKDAENQCDNEICDISKENDLLDEKCNKSDKLSKMKVAETEADEVSQVRKRRADSSDGQSSGDLKRTRLDMVIGKLGTQIGISPDTIVCDDLSESEDSRPDTESSESSKLSDAPSMSEDCNDEANQSSKKKMKIAEKQLEELIRTKIVSHLKSQKEGLISQLQKRIEELQTSNDTWKIQVRDLQKQVLEVTVLQQKHEKRKAATAALRQITTRSVGIQVADKTKTETNPPAVVVIATPTKQQKTPPVLLLSTPSTAPTTVIMTPVGAMTKPITVPALSAAVTKVTGSFGKLPLAPNQPTITTGKTNFNQLAATGPVSASSTSSPQYFSTAFLQKPLGALPASTLSSVTVRSLLDSTRYQPTVSSIPQQKGIIAQPQQQGLIVMSTASGLSSTAVTKSLLSRPLSTTLSPVTATSVPQITQVGVKIIDLTDDDDIINNAARQSAARTVTLTAPTVQQVRPGAIMGPQIIRQVGPIQAGVPQQGILLSTGIGTQIMKTSQALQGQPQYQLVLGTNSQAIRTGSVLTVVAPTNTQNTTMRPVIPNAVNSSLRSAVTNLVPVTVPALPQLRPGQSITAASGAATRTIVMPQTPLPSSRLPPPLQSAPHQTSAVPKVQTFVNQANAVTVVTPAQLSVHPAPLPVQPQNTVLPGQKALPPKPGLKISRVSQGIVLSWNMTINDLHAEITNYQLFAYQEGNSVPSSLLWKKVGDVKALPLPMACTLTHFQEGNKYHFAVRAVDIHERIGLFSDPSSIHLTKN